MNAQAGLPEVLASRQRRVSVSEDATQGLGISRGAHCSIRAARFRLIDANGVETLVPNLYLDVVIIRANPKDSKLYFPGPYNPDSGDPPACYSDNGIGPSSNALQPQSPLCSTCPHNQMNSKINPQTGKGSKACSDRKKLAFIIPGDPAVNVYELQVPPDSLKAMKDYAKFLSQQATGGQRKVDIGDMVTRLSFDSEASHPRLKFEPVGWADDAYTLQMIDYIYDQQLDVAAVGLNDVPADPEIVKQAIGLRAQYAQLAPQAAQPAQFQLPSRQEPAQPLHMQGVAMQQAAAMQGQQAAAMQGAAMQQAASFLPPQSGNGQAQPQQEPKPRGRPKKQPEQLPSGTMMPLAVPAHQFSPPTPAAPVAAAAAMPDIPEFLRRPAVNAAPPVSPQPAQPQPSVSPQYGMAGAPPPPPQVAEALQAAMRMPPRR
jgi:hypothetical protein